MTTFLHLLQWLLFIVNTVTVQVIGVISFGFIALLSAAFLAPIGALRWWAGWSGDKRSADSEPFRLEITPEMDRANDEASAAPPSEHFLVYLSGIGDVSGSTLPEREFVFLQHLAARLPQVTLIHNIFSFSVTNVGLTEEQLLGRFWQWVHANKISGKKLALLGGMINMRNLLQVAVSADRRYGPIYNCGTASVILRTLLQRGYRLGSGTPITLFGYSGGGQIVLGSSRYLKTTLQTPLQVISLGGVMNSDPSVSFVDHLYHLYGDRDSVQRVGDIAFPKRWPVFADSPWNRALAAGQVQRICLGPMAHSGVGGYLDSASHLENGRSYLDHTLDTTCQLVNELTARQQPASEPINTAPSIQSRTAASPGAP